MQPNLAPYWWLGGTTCHRHTSVAWASECGRFLLLKHWGHSEWCGWGSGNQYCETYYCLFDIEHVNKLLKKGKSGIWRDSSSYQAKWTGRWTKAKQKRMESLCR